MYKNKVFFKDLTKKKKTNHQTGYHKPVVNPTTNYGPDSHKKFCERCEKRNGKGKHCRECSL